MSLHVVVQLAGLVETPIALRALVSLLRLVLPHVRLHVLGQLEAHPANSANMRPLRRVSLQVGVQVGRRGKGLFAQRACVRPLLFGYVRRLDVFVHRRLILKHLLAVRTLDSAERDMGIGVPVDVVADREGLAADQALVLLERGRSNEMPVGETQSEGATRTTDAL